MEKMFRLIILILIQLIFNAVLVSSEVSKNLFSYPLFGPGIALPINIVITVISIYLILQSVDLITKEQKLQQLESQNSYNEDLSTAIRTIKHDVANQILIIDGLYQLGKGKDSIAYSRKMINKFDWMENVLKLKNPEVVSLIINKINEANDYGIETNINVIDVKKNEYKKIPIDKLTRIISNLLDNAIFALKEAPSTKRILKLRIDSNLAFFEVENSGTIDKDVQVRVFEKGFTTKDVDGQGLGLFIVKTLTEEMNGKLDFVSKDNIIRFKVEF